LARHSPVSTLRFGCGGDKLTGCPDMIWEPESPNQGVNASGGRVLDDGGRVRRRRVTPIVELARCAGESDAGRCRWRLSGRARCSAFSLRWSNPRDAACTGLHMGSCTRVVRCALMGAWP
jgi:hypothetical protein